ncbi:MAG: hypothetical protein GX267_10325 [Fibrobacter sp.]|jgi:hypothetical protein|nr:hypothetical protein [Fibrobacter sp.]
MNRITIFVLLVTVSAGIIFFQNQLSEYGGQKIREDRITIVPKDERIKAGLLGFETTFSHILWIKTVLYFGSHYSTDKNYPWIVKMVDLVTRLNPQFYPAYEFAGVMLPELCNNPDAARVILERGLFHIGDKKWNVPFYLSLLYYKYYDQQKIAADYMALASRVQGAPADKLAGIASAMYTRAGFRNSAEEILILTHQASENPEVRSHLALKIKQFHSQWKNEQRNN